MFLLLSSLLLSPLPAHAEKGASFSNDQVCVSGSCFHLDVKGERDAFRELLSGIKEQSEYAEFNKKELKSMIGLESALLDDMDTESGEKALLARNTLLEIHRSFILNTESPFPDGFDAVKSVGYFVRDFLPSRYIRGKTQASPNQSLFQSWESHGSIPSLDLTAGPKTKTPFQEELDSGNCTYLKPKTGTGTRPGFKISCDGKTVKVKFKEVHSHPFAARILWALGYAVAPATYAPHMTLPYERRIFTEINSREGVTTDFKAAGIKLFKLHYNPKKNMLDYVDHATLKSGKVISTAELGPMIGNAGAEAEIATITTKELQTQVEDSKLLQVGEWSYNDFDHPSDRGIRALAVPLAWMGGWDFRQDNNVLAVDLSGPTPKYEFYLPDLGGVLGSARSYFLFFNTIESVKGLDHPIAKHGRLARYQTIENNQAFKDCTRDDARWMLSLLNQLSIAQIRDALSGAGFKGDELDQFLEVLLKRRDELTKAFH